MGKDNILQKSESSLVAKKICLESMNFQRTTIISGTVRLTKSSISKNIATISEDNYKCSLAFRLSDDEETTSLEIVVSGIFELKADLSLDQKEVIIAKNTMAILFPYLRSQVTLLTAQPDIEPVVLPIININALLQNMEN